MRLLGMIHAQLGKLDSAARLMKGAVECSPESAEGHNNLGMVLHALKRDDQAIVCYETAIAIRPRYAIALNNLGVMLAALERHEEAIARYQEALAAEPDYAEALNNLGAALHKVGRDKEAVEQFRAALAVRTEFPEAEINLGHTLAALGRTRAAIACYQTALRQQPENAQLHVNLADVLFKKQRHNGAILHYKRAWTIQSDLADAHAGCGGVHQEIGRINEARRCFERAIAINPRHPGYYLSLARSTQLSPADPNLARMLGLMDDLALLSDADKINLHFALGKALADIGRHQRSFEHLMAGNALKRSSLSYDEADEIAPLDRARQVFTVELMQCRLERGAPSSIPIFIVSMPRSGSTLVEQILASHPKVFGAGELNTFHEATRATGLHARAMSFPDSVPDWTDEQMRAIANYYSHHVNALASSTQHRHPVERITDKMPSNFRYVGLINLALPYARIIHTHRDPIDTCLSCFSLVFDKMNFNCDLGELERRYNAYARLMQH